MSVDAQQPDVIVATENGVMIVTINRPAARNAITRDVSERIAAAMDELDARDDLSVAIITGEGGHFSAGMDLKDFAAGRRPSIPGRGFAGVTESPPAKPLIAAVEGYALAGGFEIVLACDLAVASREAKFGIPEVKRGLVAAGGGLVRLPRLISPRIALELALTGDFLSAERAAELGLVNRLAAPGEALAAAKELANAITANAPLAVQASKRVMHDSQDWSSEAMFDRQRELTEPVFASDDAKEGARAFAEKRSPEWKGQ